MEHGFKPESFPPRKVHHNSGIGHSARRRGAIEPGHFVNLSPYDQGSIIEFLKTLKVLPPEAMALIVDEGNRPIEWPPAVVH